MHSTRKIQSCHFYYMFLKSLKLNSTPLKKPNAKHNVFLCWVTGDTIGYRLREQCSLGMLYQLAAEAADSVLHCHSCEPACPSSVFMLHAGVGED